MTNKRLSEKFLPPKLKYIFLEDRHFSQICKEKIYTFSNPDSRPPDFKPDWHRWSCKRTFRPTIHERRPIYWLRTFARWNIYGIHILLQFPYL